MKPTKTVRAVKKKPAKRAVRRDCKKPMDLGFWNKIFDKMNTLNDLIESTNPSIDDHNLRWVSDRIERFNGDERILTKDEMRVANNMWKEYRQYA